MIPILVLHGPNLNLLGEREPGIYGGLSLTEINDRITILGNELGFEVKTFQSNVEGELINALHEARKWAKGVVFNPGGYTHTSVALHDAVAAIGIAVIEVHLSNVYAREKFRRGSLVAPVCKGRISGFGWWSYMLALYAFQDMLSA